MDGSTQRLLKNTLIIGIGNLGSKVVMFLLTIFISRWLYTESYGLLDLYFVSIQIFAPIFTLSIDEALFRFLLDREYLPDFSKVISSGIIIALLGCSILLIVSFLLYPILPLITVPYILLLGILLFVSIIQGILGAVARGMKKVTVYAWGNLISGCSLSIATMIFLIFFHMELVGVLYGYILGYSLAIGWFVFALNLKRYFSFKNFDKKISYLMIRYSAPLILNGTAWWIIGVSDRYFVTMWVGLIGNGIYSAANKIPAILNILYSVFHMSWIQSATEEMEKENFEKYCNKIFHNTMNFVLSASSILITANFIIYKFLFNESYSEAYYYTPILIWALVISCAAQFTGGVMVARKKSKSNGFTNIMAALINIILNIFLIKEYGLYGASFSTLLAFLILFFLRKKLIDKEVKLTVSRKVIYNFSWTLGLTILVYLNSLMTNILAFVLAIVGAMVINWQLIKERVIR